MRDYSMRLTVTRKGQIPSSRFGGEVQGQVAPAVAPLAGPSNRSALAISNIYDGDYATTEFATLHDALKAVEPVVRNPDLLRAGKEMKRFGRMRPRELLGNVLLALVANPIQTADSIRISTDPYNADGLIYNAVSGEGWLMEHVFVPGPTPANPNGTGRNVGELVLEAITRKHRNKPSILGEDYLRGKTLFVLLNEPGRWVPDDVAKAMPVPPTLNAVLVANRTGKTPAGEFVYHIVRLDWVLRFAPRWQLTIAPDFTSWQAKREQ